MFKHRDGLCLLICLFTALTAAAATLLTGEAVAALCVVFLTALVLLGFLWRRVNMYLKAKNRSVWSLFSQFLSVQFMVRLGRRQRGKLEKDTLDIKRVQEETLLQRLHKNAHTAYGRQYKFSSIKDAEGFRQCHPVTVYEHYKQLVQQVSAGEENILIKDKPLILAMTSGTSGSSNMILSTKDTSSDFFLQGVSLCVDAMNNAFPGSVSLQRTLKLFHSPTPRYSEAGIPIGPNSSTPSSSKHLLHLYTTPAPAFQVLNERYALYLHLLFALKDRNIGIIESNFCSTVFYAFRTLEERWEELVEDVECGKLSTSLELDSGVRSSLEKLLKPDHDRAAELRAQFSEGFQGIALRLWPQLHLVLAVDSGSNQIYGELLRQHYCKDLPFYSPFYAATEGLIGVNLWPLQENRQYLLCPRSMFCEFLPEESLEADQLNTLLMHQVEEGKNYELVITNAAGLYRYRIGDIVKVVKFHNQCPVVEFLYRRGQMLNVRGEKVSEALFLGALKKAMAQWPGAKLVDYCCAESGTLGDASGGAQPHYQVFLELKGVRNLTEEQRYKLDCCLQADSAVYRSFRIKGSIGPMRVQLVSQGAFQELKGHMTSFSKTSPNTFKMQRVIRRKEYADFLLGKTVS